MLPTLRDGLGACDFAALNIFYKKITIVIKRLKWIQKSKNWSDDARGLGARSNSTIA
jgi:hypothetical protein